MAGLTDAIDIVTPSAGQHGTFVEIPGARLLGGGDSIIAVTLAGVEADRGDQSDDAISVRADHGTAGTGHGVLSASSGVLATRENGWTQVS